jgi:uncharacterized protein YhbP (UPF0306 family)
VGKDGKPWLSNVFYSSDTNLNLFFVSPNDTNHIQHLSGQNEIAFSISWYDQNDLNNRKAIQGTGTCQQVKNPTRIIQFLQNHAKYFPLWKDLITYENMRNKIIDSRPYVIKPDYIKFWNDELYGEEGVKEFDFSSLSDSEPLQFPQNFVL